MENQETAETQQKLQNTVFNRAIGPY